MYSFVYWTVFETLCIQSEPVELRGTDRANKSRSAETLTRGWLWLFFVNVEKIYRISPDLSSVKCQQVSGHISLSCNFRNVGFHTCCQFVFEMLLMWSPLACSFRWVKDGEVFGSEYKESGTLRAEGDELLDSYEGLYRCYASNTLGTAMTQTVQVIVERKSHKLTICTI